MTSVLKTAGNNRQIVMTNDKVNPYGLQIEGTVVIQSWSRTLVERLAEDESFCALALTELAEAE